MILLASYPRSGNTWVRYIVECISGRPTVGDYHRKDTPIYKRLPIQITDRTPILQKSHQIPDKVNDALIIIVRDYKEAILRHLEQKQQDLAANIDNYLELLARFDRYTGRKLLIYYEDLIKTPKTEILKLSRFLELSKEKTDEFIRNIARHKKASVASYQELSDGGSRTRGVDLHYHVKLADKRTLRLLAKLIKKKPHLYNKYLKRYD